MTTTYEFTITAICPVDPSTIDVYTATLRTDTMITVELILAAAKFTEPIYQEALTVDLLTALAIPGELTTVGYHSGVKVTCSEFGY